MDTNSAGLSDQDLDAVKAQYDNETRQQVRGFRKLIDSLFLSAKTLTPSRAVSSAITAFETSRMFAGLILADLGAENPYPESSNPASSKIEDRTDVGVILDSEGLDGIGYIKKLRALSADLITETSIFVDANPASGMIEFISKTEMVKGLMLGKMWLGARLGEIKDAEK